MPSSTVRLRLQAQTIIFEFGGDETVTLPVGLRTLADNVLRHDPATAGELERAIDVVEDALTGARLAHADRGDIETTDTLLLALPGFDARGAGLSRDAIEALFQRLASRSLGTPVAAAQLPHGRDVAAALLILRECMHHLGFDRVVPVRH